MRAILLALLLSPVTHAAPTASTLDRSCAASSSSHELASRVNEGSVLFAGKCLETERIRPAKDVSVTGARLTFQNYYFEKKFWKAELDLNGIDTAFFHVKRFPTVKGLDASHTQFRFRMKKDSPIRLTGEDGMKKEAGDLILSFEMVAVRGEPLNIVMGVLPNYPIAGRVYSTDTQLAEANMPLQQYELDLSPEETKELLLTSLKTSEENAFDVFYELLRPNCTTIAFDILDSLARFKGKYPRFLSVISTDPIAGPSVRALKARGLIRRRVQDYQDELKGIEKELPIDENRAPLPAFIPEIPGLPWTVVVTGPNPEALSTREKMGIAQMKKRLVGHVLGLIQAYSASAIMAGSLDPEKRTRLLLSALRSSEEEMRAALRELESKVAPEGLSLGVYLVPMKSSGRTASLEALGLPAAVPFSVQEIHTSDRAGVMSETFYWIGANALAASDVGASRRELPAYFLGTAVTANILPSGSSVAAQFLLGLNPQEHLHKVRNEKVNLESISLPKPQGASRLTRATAVVTHRLSSRGELEPKITVDFGPFGGIAGTLRREFFGGFQVLSPGQSFQEACAVRAESVPRFTGKFGERATGNRLVDPFLNGRPVAFQLMQLQMNLQTLQVEDLQLGVSSWPINCQSDRSVDEEFEAKANEALLGVKDKLRTEADGIGTLLKKLLGQ